MNSPKFRFTFVVSVLLILWWSSTMVFRYLLGPKGLNISQYSEGVILIGGATLAGFFLVWGAVRLMEALGRGPTGFEASSIDEYGTEFRMGTPFPINLPKYLPHVFAEPEAPELHPLEAELLGFLNGFRHWPVDLDAPGMSIYQQSLNVWLAMRSLPGAGPLHRIAALSAELGKVFAYREVRSHGPWYELWVRDKVRFTRRCREHGGLAAFVLSTLPGFRTLYPDPLENRRAQRALQVALKYRLEPMGLPTNADPLARDLVDFINRSYAKIRAAQGETVSLENLSDSAKTLITRDIEAFWPSLMDELEPSASLDGEPSAVGLAKGQVAILVDVLLTHVAQSLPPEQRQILGLWEYAGGAGHPAWPLIRASLLKLGVMLPSYEDMETPQGTVFFRHGETLFGPAVVLVPSPTVPETLKRFAIFPVVEEPLDVVMDIQQMKTLFVAKSHHFDTLLSRNLA